MTLLALAFLAGCDAPTESAMVQPIEPDFDQIARDSVADVDTSGFDALGN